MKPFDELSYKDKATILHQFFPTEIIAFIVYLKFKAEEFAEKKEYHRSDWNKKEQIFTFEAWLNLSIDTQKKIEANENEMCTKYKRFSDLLFDGYYAFYTVEYLQHFIKSDKCKNEKLAQAVQLFFL